MSREFLAYIFELFAQKHGDARGLYQGTGLGMAIAKGLVDKMNGTITVESKVGEGSTFTIPLPLLFEIVPSEETGEKEEETQKVSICGQKLLLVENNDLNAEIVQVLLCDEGARGRIREPYHRHRRRQLKQSLIRQRGGRNRIGGSTDNRKDSTCRLLQVSGISGRRRGQGAEKRTPRSQMRSAPEHWKASIDAGMNEHLTKTLDAQRLLEMIAKLCHT